MRLADKSVIVTGGASGFGEGIVRKFAAEGAQVLIADRDEANARRVAAETGARFIVTDVTRADDVRAMVEAAESRFGALDVLINNAGIAHGPQPLEGLPEDEFDRLFTINMKATYLSARAAVPRFKARGRGVILNMASTAAISPRPNLCWYNASKGWMLRATRAMAIELAPFGIRVNCVCPVAGDTPMLPIFLGSDTPENRARFIASIPLGRLSTPADVANAACYLCSDEAGLVTGVALEVDGGRCI